MKFGDRILRRGDVGPDVEQLQLRLAGFLGTVWDADFGPKTEKQVLAFQRDYMKVAQPSGTVTAATFQALDRFADEFAISFTEPLRCTFCRRADGAFCTQQGFGQARFRGVYLNRNRDLEWSRLGRATVQERKHQYEYPGIHRAVLQTFRAFRFYAKVRGMPPIIITSGYRCHINNVRKSRFSTNHMGKALDFTFDVPDSDERHRLCQQARQLLKTKSGCQVRWTHANKKALEPGVQEIPGEFIAKTWVHLDVRQYDKRYLADRHFVTSQRSLDKKGLDD